MLGRLVPGIAQVTAAKRLVDQNRNAALRTSDCSIRAMLVSRLLIQSGNVLRCAWLAGAKTLAFALGARGIHVNTLSLGGTLTPGYATSLDKRAASAGVTFKQRLAEKTLNVPLRKYGAPEEVAAAVEGLLSAFSDHMTGINIQHDGGFTSAY